jgi:GLPGLI family protein
MNTQKIVAKIKLFFVLLLLFVFSTACNEVKTGKATYTFTIKVSEEFMQKEREKAEAMAGGDEKLFEEVMKHITKSNSKRIYSLFFQENKTVFSIDTEWYGQEDPNKTYIDYQAKEVIYPRNSEVTREAFPKEKWNITDESKKIGEWDVQKATAEFDGQVITAWFSKHPTLRITPREYVGLEGIVVEIQLEAGAKYTLTNFELDKSVKVDLP